MPSRRYSKSTKTRGEAKGQQVSARLKKKDESQFFTIAKNEFSGNGAEAARELISEALSRRRLLSVGKDQTLTEVKEAQQEVVSAETQELKALLKDVIAILKSSGTSIDRVVNQNREIYGVIFHVLRKVLRVEDATQEHLVRPALVAEGKDDDEISESLVASENEFTGLAQTLLETVRTHMSQVTT